MIARIHEVLKLERPLIGVDLETTGVDVRSCGICELGLEIMVPGLEVKEYRTLVNPMLPIPAGATRVHGIDARMVAEAPTFKQLAANLYDGLRGCDFIGYCLGRFDLPMLREEFKRAGFKWDWENARVIDGLRTWQIAEGRTLSDAVARWLIGSSKIDEAAILREIATADGVGGKAHDALWDIKMSTRVVAAQLLACKELPKDIQALHDLQWPDRYDCDGKLRYDEDGWLCFGGWGTHKGKRLTDVPKGYLSWIIREEFSDKVKAACRATLAGRPLKKDTPHDPTTAPHVDLRDAVPAGLLAPDDEQPF